MPLPGLKDTALWTSAKTLKKVRIKAVALFGRTYTVQHGWTNTSIWDELWLWVKLLLFHVFPVGKTSLVGPLSWGWFGNCAESCGIPYCGRLGLVFAGLRVCREPPKTLRQHQPVLLLMGVPCPKGSAGHPPGTTVPKILFLPCSPELAVVDTVSPGVPCSLVQHHTLTEAEPGLNASLWIWVQRGIRLAHGR